MEVQRTNLENFTMIKGMFTFMLDALSPTNHPLIEEIQTTIDPDVWDRLEKALGG